MDISTIVNGAIGMCGFLVGLALVVALILSPILFHMIGYFVYLRFVKKVRRPKRPVERYKEPKLLKQLYYFLPRQIVKDFFNFDADAFDQHGIHLIVGTQGKGKTVTLVHLIRKLKHEFPELQVFSNMSLKYADGRIESVEDIISHQDIGKTGKIEVLDEVQNWFNSNESRNVPPELLSEICQQRKQYSIMLMTTQVYNNLVSQIKSQIDYIYNPYTLFGCFTIVRVYHVKRDEKGGIVSQKLVKLYSFVQDDEIRNAFDTHEKVKRLVKGGFKERDKQLQNNETVLQLPKLAK